MIQKSDKTLEIKTLSIVLILLACIITKKIFIIIMIFLVICMFYLDLKFALKLEHGDNDNNSPLRINNEKFSENPNEEIARYVEDVNYYNNIWRTALGITAIISLILYPIITPSLRQFMPYFSIVIFCVVYHYWNWKSHHSLDFIFKTVVHSSRYLAKTKSGKGYFQLKHI